MTLKEKMKDSLSIGKQGKSGDMLKEMNTKMQRLLEETLEKNIQLEKVSFNFTNTFFTSLIQLRSDSLVSLR